MSDSEIFSRRVVQILSTSTFSANRTVELLHRLKLSLAPSTTDDNAMGQLTVEEVLTILTRRAVRGGFTLADRIAVNKQRDCIHAFLDLYKYLVDSSIATNKLRKVFSYDNNFYQIMMHFFASTDIAYQLAVIRRDLFSSKPYPIWALRKEAYFRYMMLLPHDEKKTVLQHALDKDDPLGRLFWQRRKFWPASLRRGTLNQVKLALDKLNQPEQNNLELPADPYNTLDVNDNEYHDIPTRVLDMTDLSEEDDQQLLIALVRYYNDNIKIRRQSRYLVYLEDDDSSDSMIETETPYFVQCNYSFYIFKPTEEGQPFQCYTFDHTKKPRGCYGKVLRSLNVFTADIDSYEFKLVPDSLPLALKIPDLSKYEMNENANFSRNEMLLREYYFMPKHMPNHTYAFYQSPWRSRNYDKRKSRFFMPFVGDFTLIDVQPKKIDEQDALNIASNLTHFVADMHEHKDTPTVHRDIKPENVRVTNQHQACLVDFAFAEKMGTDRCRLRCTPIYSPREINYASTYRLDDPSHDVYSLCLLLFQMLIAKRWDALSEINFQHNLRQNIIKARCSYISYQFDESKQPQYTELMKLIGRGFSLTPTERPSARELHDCLQSISLSPNANKPLSR